MPDFARVTSLDVLRDFKAALADFAEQAGLALSEAQSDVQRTIWWITNDQRFHWQRELKKRNEKLAQAKSDLNKAQIASNDTRTSAVLERKNLAKAQARVDEAEEKLRMIKKWHFALERELMLFKAQCGQVAGAVAGDIPVAMARMDKMIGALEAYISLAAPAGGSINLASGIPIENPFTEPMPGTPAGGPTSVGPGSPPGDQSSGGPGESP